MSAAENWELVSEEDYLAQESQSAGKHEYVGGVVYAMAGATNRHNDIVGNTFAVLHMRLRGGSCKPCNSDTKVRIRLTTNTRFYYPDAMIVCRPNKDEDTFQDEPTAIFEVLSESTRRADEGEKRESYLTIPTLRTYVMLESNSRTAIVFTRKSHGFERTVLKDGDSIAIPEPDIQIPLSEIYDGISFDEA